MRSTAAQAPTFIDTILHACRQVENGRSHRDVAIHALTELGELAQEVQIVTCRAPGKKAGPDGISGEAVDLILCVVDFLYCIDPMVDDSAIMRAVNAKEDAGGTGYATFILDSPINRRPIPPCEMPDYLIGLGSDLGELCGLEADLDASDLPRAIYPASRIIADCILLIRAVITGATEEHLLALSERKLDKWLGKFTAADTDGARPGDFEQVCGQEQDPVALLRSIASGASTTPIPAYRLSELHDIATMFEEERQRKEKG